MAKKEIYDETRRVITIPEARKLIGKQLSDSLTNAEMLELIDQLEFIASLAIKKFREHKVE